MANINWDVVFYFDPLALRTAASGVAVPTYGDYGGPGYSEGVFGPLAAPYEPPMDALDAQFLTHDVASVAAAASGQQAAADLDLLRGVVALAPAELDAEASVYAGLTTLTMLGRLAAEGGLGLLSPGEAFRATLDAAQDIERGLAGLDAGERDQAENWLLAASTTTSLALTDALGGLDYGNWLA